MNQKTSTSNSPWVPHFKANQFPIIAEIAIGGEATVYLANSDHFGEVALKKLDRKSVLSGNSREADILMKIKHPHIVQIFGILLDDDDPAKCSGFVMEYMKLGSLHNVIYNFDMPPYGMRQILSWVIQASRGLQYLHEQNIIHRDVKPKNILMSSLDVLKLADFGIAREVTTESVTFCVGTVCYMAPELIKDENKRKYAYPVDVYSLAVTLWEMIHRKIPFNEIEDFGLLNIALKVLEGDRPIIDPAKVDQELAEFLQSSWHQDPSERICMAEMRAFAIRRLKTSQECLDLTETSGYLSTETQDVLPVLKKFALSELLLNGPKLGASVQLVSECAKMRGMSFRHGHQAIDLFNGVGRILRTLLNVAEPINSSTKFLHSEINQLALEIHKLRQVIEHEFKEIEPMIEEHSFTVEVTHKMENQERLLENLLSIRTEQSLVKFIEECDLCTPLKRFSDMIELIKEQTTNPIRYTMNADALRSRNILRKWRLHVQNLVGKLAILQGVFYGLKQWESDGELASDIRELETVLDDFEKDFKVSQAKETE